MSHRTSNNKVGGSFFKVLFNDHDLEDICYVRGYDISKLVNIFKTQIDNYALRPLYNIRKNYKHYNSR